MKLKDEESFWILWIIFFLFASATAFILGVMIEVDGGPLAVVIDAGRELMSIYNEIMR